MKVLCYRSLKYIVSCAEKGFCRQLCNLLPKSLTKINGITCKPRSACFSTASSSSYFEIFPCKCIVLNYCLYSGKAHKDKPIVEEVPGVNNGKITLLDSDDKVLGVMDKFSAREKADGEALKLVLIKPDAHPYPIYKLMTGKELHKEQLKRQQVKKEHIKKDKTLQLSSKINKHDMETQIKKITKWLEKGHHVEVHVRSDEENESLLKNVLSEIQQLLDGTGKITGETYRGKSLRFSVQKKE